MYHFFRLLFFILVTYWIFPLNAAEYIGSEVCQSCHNGEWQDWMGSHHQLAMAEATESTVLADFNDTEFQYNDILSQFDTRDGNYYVTTENADGQLEEFQITHTFGWEPLQQYLVSFEDGRKQVLNLSWDARPASEGGQRWFHLYPDEDIKAGDLLHWTAFTHNWNTSCAACHSTNLEKNYEVASNQFDTTWSEINVACESCHGPGSDHQSWAAAPSQEIEHFGFAWSLETTGGWTFTETNTNFATRVNAPLGDKPYEQEVCAQCHSLRNELQPFTGSYHDAFQLSPALEPLYHIDGQIQEEVFVMGSFTQSKMHDQGVTCSNCHDPHTLELVAEPNVVCAQCHNPGVYDTEEHHFHPIESVGAVCVDCHMPENIYMVIDPRRDHSIRIPRPDLSEALDTPNACSNCHTDQSVAWASEAFNQWWPNIERHHSESIHAAQQAESNSLSRLFSILSEPDTNAMARYQVLQQVAASGLSDPNNSFNAIRRFTRSDSVIERQGAINALASFPLEQSAGNLLPLLEDEYLSIRIAAASQLATIDLSTLSQSEQNALENAINETQASLEANLDSPGLALQLSNLFGSIGDIESALVYAEQALTIAPNWPPALVNQASLYSRSGDEEAARSSLTQAINAYPDIGDPYYSLGLLQIRTEERNAALLNLERANILSPDNAHYGYVYGIALYETGQPEAAIEKILESYDKAPSQGYIGISAMSYQLQLGLTEQARETLQLLKARGADPVQLQQLEAYLNQLP